MNLIHLIPILAVSTIPAFSAVIGTYKLTSSHSLDSFGDEASAVAYNRDRDSLFVIGDEGGPLTEYSKTGQRLSTMALNGFEDTESLIYLGSGKFLVGEERLQRAYEVTYNPALQGNRGAAVITFSTTVGNIGLEGMTYDRLTNSVWGVKETAPQSIYQLMNFGGAGSVTVNPFHPSLLGLVDLSDIFALSASNAFTGTDQEANLLILSQESKKLLEVTRDGTIVSTLDLAFLGRNTIEGVTMDDNGTLYLVAEQDGADPNSRLYVLNHAPEPSTAIFLALGGLAAFRRRR